MPSWVVLILLVLPIAAALAIFALERLHPNFGLAWLIAMLAALGGWGLLLALGLRNPAPLQRADWLPFQVNLDDRLLLQVDPISWPLAFSLAALLLAVILTAPVRLGQKSIPAAWASNLFITSMGLMGVLSGNLITLLLVWSLIDVVELIIMLRTVQEPRLNRQAVLAFAARVSGTIVALAALVVDQDPVISGIPNAFPQANVLLLMAAGLRLGVLPLNLPYQQEIRMRRGVGTLLRMVSAATSLVLLARLTPIEVTAGGGALLLVASAIAAWYAAAMWASAANELAGRPYWIISLAGMALISVINGNPLNSLAWSTLMILCGGLLFLYSGRAKFSIVLPILAAVALSGLPFTPAAFGWPGVVDESFTIFDLALVLIPALLMVGMIRHAMTPGDALRDMQGWIRVAYPMGLFLLGASAWLIVLLGTGQSLIVGPWAVSLASSLVAVGMLFAIYRWRSTASENRRFGWLQSIVRVVGKWLTSFFNLRWLYALLNDFMRSIRRLVEGLSEILEGEGGVLWVLVLLALLLTLLLPEGLR